MRIEFVPLKQPGSFVLTRFELLPVIKAFSHLVLYCFTVLLRV